MKVAVNINDIVWVKLSEAAHRHLEDRDVSAQLIDSHKVDDGWHKFQLHQFMFYFGDVAFTATKLFNSELHFMDPTI